MLLTAEGAGARIIASVVESQRQSWARVKAPTGCDLLLGPNIQSARLKAKGCELLLVTSGHSHGSREEAGTEDF